MNQVTAYRKMLISKEGQKKRFAEVDEFGRPVLKETHQIAEAMKEKNNKLKDAFGIPNRYVEGASFATHRKEEVMDREEKEAAEVEVTGSRTREERDAELQVLARERVVRVDDDDDLDDDDE
mgnify:CR=1 FL=1